MKDIKIIVKCKGLRVRTNDLEMGLGILDQIAKHGIMNYNFISNKLLNRANNVINSTRDTMAGLIDKVKEKVNVSEPELNVSESEPSEEVIEEKTKELPAETRPKTRTRQMSWLIEEDKLLCDLVKKSPAEIVKHEGLQRHTANSIRTRLSIFRIGRFDRLTLDRANVMRAYMSGKKVSTPVADIEKAKSSMTPITDAQKKKYILPNSWTEREIQILRDNPDKTAKELTAYLSGRTVSAITVARSRNKIRATGKKSPESFNVWSDAEKQVIIDNQGKSPKKYIDQLPGRTLAATQAKRIQLKSEGLVSGKVTPSNAWTNEEIEAIKMNINLTANELKKLPWLKHRTRAAITVMKAKIKAGQYEDQE